MSSKFSGLALAVDKPQRMTILHPVTRAPLKDAEGQEAWVEAFSGDSGPARDWRRALVQRRLATRNRRQPNAEEIETDTVDLLVGVTQGWRLLDLEGNPIEIAYSKEAARELYADPALAWLREQVDEFVADRGNFSKASSTS